MTLPAAPLARRAFRTVRWLFLGGLTAVFLLVTGLLIEDAREVSLPLPSGPYAVGRVIDDWVDPATIDPLSPAPGTTRELLVWIWYPAVNVTDAFDDYLPAAMRPRPEKSDATNPWTYFTRDPSLVRSHSRKDADVAPGGPFPIVLLRAGGSSGVLNYSSLAEDLASHGFVVGGIRRAVSDGSRHLSRWPRHRHAARKTTRSCAWAARAPSRNAASAGFWTPGPAT